MVLSACTFWADDLTYREPIIQERAEILDESGMVSTESATINGGEDVSDMGSDVSDEGNDETVQDQEGLQEGEDQPVEEPKPDDTQSVSGAQTFPEEFLLDVPFTSQAPHRDWGDPYQDACEEASLIMADWYFSGETKISKDSADSEIHRAVAWEDVYFGFNKSTDTEETAKMAEKYFDLRVEIITEVTAETIKSELLAGRLVIVPATGRTLGNPNFTGEGPLYHMFVVRGWDGNEFITNDPGTRRGEAYRYTYQVVLDSTHDWNGGDIYNGAPRFLSVWR